MNEKTLEVLGYSEVKDKIKQFTASGLGAALVDQMQPATNPKVVMNIYREVVEAVAIIRDGTGIQLGGINNITPYLQKLNKGLFLRPEELIKMADFMRAMRHIKKSVNRFEYSAPKLYSYAQNLADMSALESEIEYCIDGNRVHSQASVTLKKLRTKIESLHSKRLDKLNKFLASAQNAKYLQENYYSTRDQRYVVPIKASEQKFVSGSVIDASATGATVYIELDSIKTLTVEIIMLKAQADEEENRILMMISNNIADRLSDINNALAIVAKYDFIMAKAKYSVSIGGSEITIGDDEVIDLKGARHPQLGDSAIPLDISCGSDYRTLVITGPNTGGKTITLKTVGLIVLMVQSGLLPPVASGSQISLFNKVLVDIGDSQSIENSLSTFSGHMASIGEIIKTSSRRTLVLIDEIGTGTDPNEGAALGIAILEMLYNRGAITLVSTHYSKIKEYSDEHIGFINASMDFDKNTLKPLYRLVIGKSGASQGLWIAKHLGLPDKLLARAGQISQSHRVIACTNVAQFAKKKNRLAPLQSKAPATQTVRFQKGDQVILTETGETALVYQHDSDNQQIKVYLDQQYRIINDKRVQLKQSREALYPADYDLDQLFTSFKARQLEKDIKRGGFKNLNELKARFKEL